MRKALFILTVAALASCTSGDNTKVKSMASKDSTAANASLNNSGSSPFASNFQIADPSLTATILDLYRIGRTTIWIT